MQTEIFDVEVPSQSAGNARVAAVASRLVPGLADDHGQMHLASKDVSNSCSLQVRLI